MDCIISTEGGLKNWTHPRKDIPRRRTIKVYNEGIQLEMDKDNRNCLPFLMTNMQIFRDLLCTEPDCLFIP